MFGNCFGNFGTWLGEIGPRFLVMFTFMPCGLLMGYTMASFAVDRKHLNDVLYYGPLILGCIISLFTAVGYVGLKFWRNKILFFHLDVLIATCFLNIIASILFFVNDSDIYGSYMAFISYGITFITALTYLNIIASKNNRTIILSICFAWYLFGMATSLSLIHSNTITNVTKIDYNINNNNDLISNLPSNIIQYNETENITNDIIFNEKNDQNETIIIIKSQLSQKENLMDNSRMKENENIYQGMAGIYLTSIILIIIMIIFIKIYNYLGNLDYKKSFDYDVFIANSNETIFDTRSDILKQMNFFYVTKNKQWLVSFILLFCDSIHFSLFIYITSWFIYNPAISLTKDYNNFSLIYWIIFSGSILGIIALCFVSIKLIFVVSTVLQIFLLFLGMIIRNTTLIPLWIFCFLYGMNFSNIKIQVLETSHLKFSELMIFISCTTKLCAIGVINVSFMGDPINSIFYREDAGTLIAHCLAFITISSLITIIVTIKVPRTYRNSLFDIQNCLLGIVYKKHQIEQLNVKYLKDGTIPTISQNVDDDLASA